MDDDREMQYHQANHPFHSHHLMVPISCFISYAGYLRQSQVNVP
ncbi:Uncharacterized protein BM_BM13305 [Brugia malayi]|uniref:Bm13305 n=1 Tax=Brugia malayi TaxID=6279 RepID=A0A0K0IXF7_BRUMA|nr:Uncharacterized protein BM_BM13305 [Brugia malayi]CDQ00448.1 Bm13305 [Brugia malayi]VIO86257.1 Uncharacterized protein BM_BM13305 [Brugia malayi]